jgi:hypothetical protein
MQLCINSNYLNYFINYLNKIIILNIIKNNYKIDNIKSFLLIKTIKILLLFNLKMLLENNNLKIRSTYDVSSCLLLSTLSKIFGFFFFFSVHLDDIVNA